MTLTLASDGTAELATSDGTFSAEWRDAGHGVVWLSASEADNRKWRLSAVEIPGTAYVAGVHGYACEVLVGFE